jgi:hypothetical protein
LLRLPDRWSGDYYVIIIVQGKEIHLDRGGGGGMGVMKGEWFVGTVK